MYPEFCTLLFYNYKFTINNSNNKSCYISIFTKDFVYSSKTLWLLELFAKVKKSKKLFTFKISSYILS